MIQHQLTTTAKELEQILALQQQNLSKNLSTQEKKEQGFVTLEHSFQELKKFHDIYPHIIAKDNNILVGYALSMDKSCKGDIELLRPMFDEIDAIYYDPYIVMGQICIDHNYRGKGVFKGLYTLMQKTFASKYTAIITEIDIEIIKKIKFIMINENFVVNKKSPKKLPVGNNGIKIINKLINDPIFK